MNIEELKKQVIRERLGIGKEYGKIFSFIDFGNVIIGLVKMHKD